MSVMDFKLKGRTWAGNFYQKFEAMCQEVDDIVRQDKVKYVGNHVQNVGESVKKLYSDAVQDLFPSSVKHETQAATLKPNDVTDTYMESMISIEENTEDIDFEQSNDELNANDTAKKHLVHASSFSGLHFVNEPITVPSLNLIEQEESDLPFGRKGKFPAYANLDAGIGKTSSEELSPLEDRKLISSVERRAREGPLFSEFSNESRESALGILTEASLASPVHNDEFRRSPQNEETMPNDLVDELDLDPDVLCTLPSSGLESSVFICGNGNSEMGCSSSVFSSSTESCKESATSTENSSEKTWESCNRNDAEMCGSCNFNTFSLSESLQILSCKNNVADTRVASSSSILSVESNGRLDDSSDDLADPCMETIELDDEVKLGESCVIVDSDVLHAFSRRAGRLRSYKKLIQDAFASRKRLAKEYEQLAIWYGDVDIDTRSSQRSSLDIVPSSLPATSSDLKKIPGQDSRDSEWELL